MVEKKKLKLKIIHVELEKTADKIDVLRITLKSKKGTYIKGVKLEDWENPKAKKSVIKTWLRDIDKVESRKVLPEEVLDAKVKSFEGEEMEEDA